MSMISTGIAIPVSQELQMENNGVETIIDSFGRENIKIGKFFQRSLNFSKIYFFIAHVVQYSTFTCFHIVFCTGDMVLTPEQYREITISNESASGRGIAPNKMINKKWNIPVPGQPNMVGVPYTINRGFTAGQRKTILDAMKEIQKHTCIR